MSRLGKKPVSLLKDVTAKIENGQIIIKGPKGELKRTIPQGLSIIQSNGQLSVQISSNEFDAVQGCIRKLIENMVLGVTQGFKRDLQIEGVGYRAQATGNKISLQLGFSKPYEFVLPAGIKISIDAKQTAISVEGNDKEVVGRVAAQIRSIKPPEPYKGTGIRYQNEQVKKKPGKAAAGATSGPGGGAKK